jgi:hypothetical protein
VEVDTPHGVFIIEQDGYYRVAVNGERTSFITRRGGQAADPVMVVARVRAEGLARVLVPKKAERRVSVESEPGRV